MTKSSHISCGPRAYDPGWIAVLNLKDSLFPVSSSLTESTKRSNEAIRNYSGTSAYENTFTLTAPINSQRTMLPLGKVADIASVSVNGKQAGIVWATPWELDITDFMKPDTNTPHIRLLANAALPPAQRTA